MLCMRQCINENQDLQGLQPFQNASLAGMQRQRGDWTSLNSNCATGLVTPQGVITTNITVSCSAVQKTIASSYLHASTEVQACAAGRQKQAVATPANRNHLLLTHAPLTALQITLQPYSELCSHAKSNAYRKTTCGKTCCQRDQVSDFPIALHCNIGA
jgi:hypothetical protein